MAGEFLRRFDHDQLVALLADRDFISGTDLEGRNIDLAAVYQYVAVAHDLARLAPRNRKAQAIHHVVQAAFELLQQQFAGDASGTGGLLEVVAELAFLGEVRALRLLLLAKLKPVAHDLGLAVFTVLAGREIALFDRTFVGVALCALEEQLHSLAAAKAAYCVSVPCQVTFSFGPP